MTGDFQTPPPFRPQYEPESDSTLSQALASVLKRIHSQFGRVRPLWWTVGIVSIVAIISGIWFFNKKLPTSDAPVTPTTLMLGTHLTGEAPLSESLSGVLDFVLVDEAIMKQDGVLETTTLETITLSESSEIPQIAAIRPSHMVILSSTKSRQAYATSIMTMLKVGNIDGVIIDYGQLTAEESQDFHQFIERLYFNFNDIYQLGVRLPTPTQIDGEWSTGHYNWPRLADMVDMIIVTPPGNPGEYTDNGLAGEFLDWAVSVIDPQVLYLSFPALSIDQWAENLNPIPYSLALDPLGQVDLNPASLDTAQHPEPGQKLTFELVGSATTIDRHEESGLYYHEIFAGGGKHRIWLMTPAALRQQLDWLAGYQVGGLILEDLPRERANQGLITAHNEFKQKQPSTLTENLSLEWTIRYANEGDIISQEITDLGQTITWTPQEEGDYIISANLAGVGLSDRGALPLLVGGETVGVVPEQEGIVAGSPQNAPVVEPPPIIPADMPAPVVPAGTASMGSFELGGQVNHVIRHPDQMRQAGMTWVKFQLAWGTGMEPGAAWELISQGREQGFKVLLSIVGNEKFPTDIEYEEFLDFLGRVAYYGPEAIEVWNEVNIDFEWPRGQIDGGTYTREMLAPAYNAIKSVNSNIMVISAAPAPTGAFFADGGCSPDGVGCDDWLYLQQMAQAGAANYMDCIGAHFNSGATSPYDNTGHPADPGYQHYSWYFPGMLQLYGGTFMHPVCFTELGYLSSEGYGGVPGRFGWASDITVAKQAQWLAEAAQSGRTSGQVRLMIVWNVDFTYWGEDPMAGYAIMRPDGTCPACQSLGNVMP